MSDSRRIARVVLDSRLPQLSRPFDYLIPPDMDLREGVRVRVPLRSAKRLAEGYVLECTSGSEHSGKLAEIAELVSPVPVLPRNLWDLASAVASRSAGNAADVLRLAIPKRYVKTEKSWWQDGAALNPSDRGTWGPPESATYGRYSAELPRAGARTSFSLPYGMSTSSDNIAIPRSREAVAHLGVQTLAEGESVIVVCPDWRDVEQCWSVLRGLVPEDRVALLAGDQPPAQRYAHYLRTLEPSPVIVLGARHAVYAPAHNLGLIIVVDDADAAHREPLAPYPHSRDVALLRNTMEDVAVCFASVTPSLAVRRWTDMGYLQERSAHGSSRPRVIPTSLSIGHEAMASPARLPSSVYQAAKIALESGPVLVQVFRSGFSPGLSCAQCTSKAFCHHCGGPLRKPSASANPSCLWCGVVDTRWSCPECSGTRLQPRGQGIGRTVSDLGKSFPSVPVIRSDGENRVVSVPQSPALVVATRGSEPVTAGGYAMVLLLDGAAMLQRDSLGALEESVHAWEHAVSYAADHGACYVTDLDGPPAMALAAGSWTQLMRHELSQRTALKLPPTLRIASLTGPSENVEAIRHAVTSLSPQVDSLGPVSTHDGGVLTVLRFPYTLGEAVVKELASWRHKLASGPRRTAIERVKIVVDDPQALDTLAGE
ncbi:MAG: primosomal protein N' [Pontimonas sp.]|nr:primosomal protein N' [Pontimonas sp.]